MKKLMLLLVAVTLLGLPASAAMNFYRAANGEILLEATDCQGMSHWAKLTTPDDPPGGTVSPEEDENADVDVSADVPADIPADMSAEVPTKPVDPVVQEGERKLFDALFGSEEEISTRQERINTAISSNTIVSITRANFNQYQKELLNYIRDVNWRTDLQLTYRDMGFFRRLKMACTGSLQMSGGMEAAAYADSTEKATDSTVGALADSSLSYAFSKAIKLSMTGVVDFLDKKNPFLLLAADDETYEMLVEKDPQVKTLMENMYTFFKIRAVLLSSKYDVNITSLVKASRIGKGNYFKTWEVLANYATIVLDLAEQGELTPQDEKEAYLWRLRGVMEYIREYGRTEKRAAKILAKDPKNAALIEEMKQQEKKKPSLNERAQELIKNSTQDEIKQLLGKYIIK